MKKIIALLLALVMVLSLAACSVETKEDTKATEAPKADATVATEAAPAEPAAAKEITLWTYPIGGWGNQETVNALMADFEAATGIKVNVDYLTYADGDDKVNTAIEGNAAPDLIMEGPERLVANWGAKGKLVNIADLYDDTDKAEINVAALAACFADANTAYEYPLVMTAHCMAINKTVFEAADAMQYINEDTHTWKSVADFEKAVEAVYNYTKAQVGAVYCVGQGGDQGTRALVNNLCGGTFTNAEHTEYTWGSEENIKALKMLYDNPAIKFDAGIAGGDEIALFYNGTLNMAFCWNIAQQLNPNSANTGAEKTANGDDIMFMAFPADGDAKLQGGIWGFGIFDNGDQGKIEAAKTFIKYFCDSEKTVDAVKAANYFAVRNTAEGTDLSGIWADNAVMAEYNVLMPLLGDYYQVTTNWAEARTAWWNMLQKVDASDGSVEAITAAVNEYVNQANGK